uniref:(California timema) hypothetical protein n=1 Tax=Timema californicum TaxID=61474 RepID=A0A7R9J9C3_TIMCA|nr:unnamed protein product [Timema californicum]
MKGWLMPYLHPSTTRTLYTNSSRSCGDEPGGAINQNSTYPISPTGRASGKERPHTITTLKHLRAMILVLQFATTHHHLSQEQHGRREQRRRAEALIEDSQRT